MTRTTRFRMGTEVNIKVTHGQFKGQNWQKNSCAFGKRCQKFHQAKPAKETGDNFALSTNFGQMEVATRSRVLPVNQLVSAALMISSFVLALESDGNTAASFQLQIPLSTAAQRPQPPLLLALFSLSPVTA